MDFLKEIDELRSSQKGGISLVLFLGALGLIAFLFLSSAAPFKSDLLSKIFPKNPSYAAEGDEIAAGEINLRSTFESIAVEVKFEGDANRNATAGLEFRKVGASAWKKGLDLWRVDPNDKLGKSPVCLEGCGSNNTCKNACPIVPIPIDSYGKAFYGSALLLADNTPYEVRVTINDPDGGGGVPMTKSISTKNGGILGPATLIPNYFVRTDGNDDNLGTENTPGGAWQTLRKAVLSAPEGAIVLVGPGFYIQPTNARITPITFKAQYTAIDNNKNVINLGKRSVIIPGNADTGRFGMSCPATANDCPNVEHKGVWVQVSGLSAPGLPGDNVTSGTVLPEGINPSASIWKWEGAPISSPTTMGYSATKNGEPLQIANWDINDGEPIDNPEGFIEKLLTNKTYNYGFSSFNNGTDLYLRLPPNAPSSNPNDLYITLGGDKSNSRRAFDLRAGNSRVSGFETRNFFEGITLSYNTSPSAHSARNNSVIDHNLLIGRLGVNFSAAKPNKYLEDNVVQYNVIRWSNLRDDDGINNQAIPWNFVKRWLTNADGTKYKVNEEDRLRMGGLSEGHAIDGYNGGAISTVIRYNILDGTFDGVAHAQPAGYDRYAGYNIDVNDNLIQNMPDDSFEPGLQAGNFKYWNNQVNKTTNFISLDPSEFGPGYVFRNTVYGVGFYGVALTADGQGVVGNIFKYSSASDVASKIYVVNNTFWSAKNPTPPANPSGGDQVAGAVGKTSERFFLRNNLFRVSLYTFDFNSG